MTDRPEIPVHERVVTIILEHMNVDPEKVTPEARLIEDLGADSLDMVELIMALEEEYHIAIPDEDGQKISTVLDVVAYVTAKVFPPVNGAAPLQPLTAQGVKAAMDAKFPRVLLGPASATTITGQPFVLITTDPDHQDVSSEQGALAGLMEQLTAYAECRQGDTLHWRMVPTVERDTLNDKWHAGCRVYIGNQTDEPATTTSLEGVAIQKTPGEVRVPTPELPRWRCHKVVQAARIADVQMRAPASTSTWLVLENGHEVMLSDVVAARMNQNVTQSTPNGLIGGYYVRYEDGYESWSPAEAFEGGYTRIQPEGTRTCAACVGAGKRAGADCASCCGTGRVEV